MLNLQEIIQATSGRLVTPSKLKKIFKGFSTDSRSIKSGEVFIALKGEKFDGHDYIRDVFKKKVGALIVSDKISISSPVPVIQVSNTTKALGYIALFHRRKFNIPVIAITGSAGKTTTKEMIAQVLSTQLDVLKNVKTENNHIGVPQTLLKLNKSHQAAVIECGTNQPGDIQWLAEILEPTIVVYTNIGMSHLEKLKNRQGVFKEKFEMVKGADSNGIIIFNVDDEYLSKISSLRLTQKKITYSIEKKSMYQAFTIKLKAPHQLEFKVDHQKFILSSGVKHNVYNALASIACGRLLNIKDSNIRKALKDFENCTGRQEIKTFNHLTVIDDTYNANPTSFKSAVDALSEMKTQGRKILICGDMLELGKNSKKFHSELGVYISHLNIDGVYSLGDLAQIISRSFQKNKVGAQVWHYNSFESLKNDLTQICSQRDTVLVKGSRGMRMDKIVEALKEVFSAKELTP